MRSLPSSPVFGMMLGSTRPGGTSKFSRASLRAKNSAEPIVAACICFSIGSFKPRPSPASRPPSQRTRRRTRCRTSADHRSPALPPCQPDRNRARGSPWPTDRRGHADRASARRRQRPRIAAGVRRRRHPVVDIGAEAQEPPAIAGLFCISTAMNGASSTRMPTFSTGVTRKCLPSSRFRMVENSRTRAGRPIGVP